MDGPTAAAGAELAHRRLVAHLEAQGFDDGVARRPSALPGWTVGHVLTHLARNADSHRLMVEAARRGEVVDQYPGGAAQRAGEIEDGAHRPATVLVEDLATSDAALAEAFAGVDPTTWATGLGRRNGRDWPLVDLPFLRWREVALHGTDLDLGLTPEEAWAPAYVDHELARQLGGLAARLGDVVVLVSPDDGDRSTLVHGSGPGGPGPVTTVAAPAREVLAWLVGRAPGAPSWPSLTPWTGSP